jgi:hypothetical protein
MLRPRPQGAKTDSFQFLTWMDLIFSDLNYEFTWTPAITFATPGDLSVSYSAQVGTGTKVGRLVHMTIDISTSAFTHTTASGSLNITGSPFTSLNVTGLTPRGDCAWQGITKANYTHAHFALAANSSTILVQMAGSGQNLASVAAADMPTGGSVILRGNLTFQV